MANKTATWNREDRDLLVELRTTLRAVQGDIKELKDGNTAALQKQQTEIDLMGERVSDLEESRIEYRTAVKAYVIVGGIANAVLTLVLAGLAIYFTIR